MYQKVENRALFAKKSKAARDKLMEMGGMAPQPQQPGGIMASSPELMQAAMRKSVVLPTQQGQPMAPPAPAPAPQPQLPPSQPIPNIAGISPTPQQPAPQPRQNPPKKPGVKKLADGGMPIDPMNLGYMGNSRDVDSMGYNYSPLKIPDIRKQGVPFDKAQKLAQKAIVFQDPRKLGLPEEKLNEAKAKAKKMEEDPEGAAKDFINEEVPEKDQTGDLVPDLKKAAAKVGVKNIPESATVDALNEAIGGALLGQAIAGNYVDPNTGQELRPTAGSRIAGAAAKSLALKRETASEREKAAQAMALQKLKNAGKSSSTKLPQNLEYLVESFLKKAETRTSTDVAAEFDETYGNGAGTKILQYLQGGAPTTPSGDDAPGGTPVGTTATGANGEKLVWDGTGWQTPK